jgi:hypothetical protein
VKCDHAWRCAEIAASAWTSGANRSISRGIFSALVVIMAPRDLRERTRLFALAVLVFCRRLPRTDEAQEAARQLRRAGNAARSNYRASRKGRSRLEFQAKLGLAVEEADECVDWLE